MPLLVFDFPDPAGRSVRRVFRDPVRVVEAGSPGEVRPALAAVEAGVAEGLHAAGFVAYEAAPAFEPAMRVRVPARTPLVWFGLFRAPEVSASASLATRAGAPGRGPAPDPDADWRLDVEPDAYREAIRLIRGAIRDGHTYQVNYTARLRATLPDADPLELYERLRRAQGTGYHALLDLGRYAVVSVSPELFFRTTGRAIATRPMKGTRPRGRWPAEDAARAAELCSAMKDRAENLMIVDLLRNDLGRVCRTGSVRTPELLSLERYPTVWQLTSTVTGELRDDVGLVDLFDALFPCGSVTGAPKISTMDLIARIEAAPRGVYCGAIGTVSPDGERAFSVPIRTLWLDRATGTAEYGTGGGVVWDSTPGGEYDELLAKALVLRATGEPFDLIETLALRGDRYPRLHRHLGRLRGSAAYFGFPFPEREIRRRLLRLRRMRGRAGRQELRRRPWLVRVRLTAAGDVHVDRRPLLPAPPDPVVALAGEPVSPDDRFLFHKTTLRARYERARAAAPQAWDVLLSNTRGEATEFTRGNLVIEIGGARVTPTLDAGLLPGCFRAELLESGRVVERPIPLADLARATRTWFVNSARGWVPVALRGQGR